MNIASFVQHNVASESLLHQIGILFIECGECRIPGPYLQFMLDTLFSISL